MRRLKTLIVGIAGLITLFLLQIYQSAVAGLIAIVMVALVVAGFLLIPKRDVFYVRTTVLGLDANGELVEEHDRIAVKVELTRLWMLYFPTFVAVGFLVVTWASGTTWRINLIDGLTPPLFSSNPVLLYALKGLAFVVWILLTAWIGERRVFRNAEACSAASVSQSGRALVYSFVTKTGDYFGGWTMPHALRPSEVSTLVFYNLQKPELNLLTMALLFHRVTVIARGVTDLDSATVTAKLAEVRSGIV